jgi:hypothetical protein
MSESLSAKDEAGKPEFLDEMQWGLGGAVFFLKKMLAGGWGRGEDLGVRFPDYEFALQ